MPAAGGSSARPRTTGGTRRPPPCRPAASRCSASCCRGPCWQSKRPGMILDLGDDAKEYGRQALRAFESAGGDQLVQQAEAKPDTRDVTRRRRSERARGVGARARTDADGLEAAAALCRSAGYWALPYPVAERLARPDSISTSTAWSWSTMPHPKRAVGGVESRWAAVTLDGHTEHGRRPRSDRPGIRGRTRAVGDRPQRRERRGARAGAAVLDAARHARPRGRAHHRACQPAQAVRADAVVVPGRAVPAHRRRSRAQRRGDPRQVRAVERRHPTTEALDDALALRMAAIEAAEVVFRVCHQLHGAVGFCDETTLSWLSRYSQPLRRLPLGLSATRDQLTRRLGRRGLTGLYSEGGR